MKGWVGVDLDGTLAVYDGWKGAGHIGEPVPAMLARVKQWLTAGQDVRIFTARVAEPRGAMEETIRRMDEAKQARAAIEAWCEEHVGQKLPITCCKDFGMIALYDDRCIQVETNTGRLIVDVLQRES